MADIFDIQDDVSASIARELQVRLMPPSKRPTQNMEAYTLFLTARGKLNIEGKSFDEIVPVLDQVLELDNQFAEVHELKAYGYWFTVASPEVEVAVHDAANKALKLDQSLIGARALATISHPTDWSWLIEFEAIQTAVAAKPTDFNLLRVLCYDLLMVGYRQESLRCTREMIALEPLSPVAYWREGLALSAIGRHDEARESFRRSIAYGRPYDARFLAISFFLGKEYESGYESLEIFPTAFSWSPVEAQGIVNKVLEAPAGHENLNDWVRGEAGKAKQINEELLIYSWLLVFGQIDEYWQVIEEFASQTESAWTNADQLEILGTAFPSTGYTAHPKYIEHGARWGLTELWEKRGKPDMCDKTDGEWVCQ
jgi:tetratricopeptide (TPR) repeat protein